MASAQTPVTAAEKADQFLTESTQFRLGSLLTESPHPRSRTLSDVARASAADGLAMLFDVDRDVVKKFRDFAMSGRPQKIAQTVVDALQAGGRIFCTGCGATGRLSIQMDSIWRDFWQRRRVAGALEPDPDEWEERTFSVMAGGDFALIKSVEGFEDFTQFGRQQIADLNISDRDVVFAITEGGETSFVIGTAWQGVDVGAKVYFVYNNPDEVLREHVIRSREVIDDGRIETVNLTTGPMAITGSTRMQATSIQLCAMLLIWEIVLREITGQGSVEAIASEVCAEFAASLEAVHATLQSEELRCELGALVEREERVYRAGKRNSYFADRLSIDVLTDTTERSPTFCIPAFRKFDDEQAAESWSFLFLPEESAQLAWRRLLRRDPRPVEWSEEQVRRMIGPELAPRQHAIMKTIGLQEIYRFKIGLDGLAYRRFQQGDTATAITTEQELGELREDGSYQRMLWQAHANGAETSLVFLGTEEALKDARALVKESLPAGTFLVALKLPEESGLLEFASRIGVKMMLNALSTCTLVRMGRVMGNVMIWVVPSNLKLIDRSTRYISQLVGVPYEQACHMLFDVIEYVSPRMRAGQVYPAPVGVSVMRLRHGLDNEQAEKRLYEELG
ncbi:MAG: hypothetical protein IT209_12970 [Armatimonadetes bacterium]|nr:hypothetical protein [Armatimonadota bacterium]